MNLRWRDLRNLTLRERFLVAPCLGLIVIALLTTAFVFEARRQNNLLDQLSKNHLSYFNRYAMAYNGLTDGHLALFRLLQRTDAADAATRRQRSAALLGRIDQAVTNLESVLAESRATIDPMIRQRHDEIGLLADSYREAVAASIASLDEARAPGRPDTASRHFEVLSQALTELLQAERGRIDQEVAARVERSETLAVVVAASGIAVAILLFAMARALSGLLSRKIEDQIDVLAELGSQAGEKMALEGRTEVERIAYATEAFRNTLGELRQAHLVLEERVAQRTQELSEANAELRSEVELRRTAEDRLRIYGEVIRSTGEAVAITDAEGHIVEINPAYQRATGRSREEAIGTPLHEAGRDPHPEEFYTALWRELKENGYWTGEVLERRGDGAAFPTWALINAVRDHDGALRHYVCVSRDITDLKRNERELQRLAFYDSLTGLPNRALFRDRLAMALAGARRDSSNLGVMFIDLDRFKYVNDTLGHAAGDRLLVEIGNRIDGCLRAADTLARMGGDEFTAVLSHLSTPDDARMVAERVIEAVKEPVMLGDEEVYVGASIGLSFHPNDSDDAETLQKYADVAMYEAKEAGRGQYRMFEAEMLERTGERLKLTTQIENALHDGEFSIVYQPIFGADGESVVSMEALIRWERDGREVAPPANFLPHAEESGLIKKIDCWVLEQACRDALAWQTNSGGPLALAVNLSAASIQQPDMAGLIKRILADTGFPPQLLHLEIAEASVRSYPNAVQAVLEELTSIGIHISVNDFGTSYASLNYLSQFPISCVKLTHQFISRVGHDKSADAIVKSLLELASQLNLTVVANGVERDEQEVFLRDAGCGQMQGHKYVEPLQSDRVANWLSTRNSEPQEAETV